MKQETNEHRPTPAPASGVSVDWLAEALRDELLEYGRLLELLHEQQDLIFAEDLTGLAKNVGAVEAQSRRVGVYAQQRDYWLAATRRRLRVDANLPWERLTRMLPAKDQVLLDALAEEVNHSLAGIHTLLRQNQQLNLRAMVLR